MPDPNLIYDPPEGWNDTVIFKDDPSDAEVRPLLQRLFTQIQTFINVTLIAWINNTFTSKDEITTNRKLSAMGDFTGTILGLAPIASDPYLSTIVAEHAAQLADNAKSRISNEYATNISSVNFPALTAGRKSRRTTYREIIAIGDSHTWGQGSADCDFSGGDTFTSRHIGQPYTGGFGNRLAEYISHKYDFYDSMVSFDNIGTPPEIPTSYYATGIDEYNTNVTDLNKKSDKINLVSGNFKIQSGLGLFGSTTDPNLFTPEVRGISETIDTAYQTTARQQKFGNAAGYFSNESADYFSLNNKKFIEITPNMLYVTEVGSITTYKNNGAIYYGFTTLDKTDQFIHIRTKILPDWLVSPSLILIEGYGLVKIANVISSLNGWSIYISNPDYSNITVDLSSCLYAGKKLYYYSNTKFKFLYSMKHHASKLMLSVFKSGTGCKVDIYFKSPYDGGVRGTDLKDTTMSNASSLYHTNKAGYPKVYRISSTGDLNPSSTPEVVISNNKITIDTYEDGIEDVVFCIDWGFKQKGILVFEYGGDNVGVRVDTSTNSTIFVTRGFYFDGNIVKINGFGSHTTSMLLGVSADIGRTATNHIAELLQYSFTCPYLLIIQPPIVNEYLAQTPLATFTSNLASIVAQFVSYRNGLYPGTLFTGVLFMSTIGGKVQEFSGTDTALIKYGDYFNALKQFCISSNYGFVDFRAWFENAVLKGVLDYEMIYDDDIHPSPFANEFIAKELFKVIDLIM